MADTNPILFDLRELVSALIRQGNIHEGKWIAGFEFNFAGLNIGGPDEEKPAALVQVNRAMLIPFADHHPNWMAVDAAEVNPAPKKKKSA